MPMPFDLVSNTRPNQLSRHLTRHLHLLHEASSSARTPVTLQRSISMAELEHTHQTHLQVAIDQEQVYRESERARAREREREWWS